MSKFSKVLLITLLCLSVTVLTKPTIRTTVENLQTTNISSKVASICNGARTIYISDGSEDGSVIVGECVKKDTPNDRQVFFYSQSSGVKNIGSMGKQSVEHLHVSADGSVIVGYFHNSHTNNPMLYHAFRYSQILGFEDLSDMSTESTFARGVSADGSWLVGSTDIGSNSKSSLQWISTHAFQYSRTDGMKDLGIMGDAAFATRISNDGSVIVGSGTIYHTILFIAEISHENFVFVYTDKGGMEKLKGIGGEQVGVTKISADGTRLVGSYRDKNRESYIYTANLVFR